MPSVVPMFPLPGVFLFPGQVMPLHIFEPRYRQMIEDLLDGPGRLVMGTVPDGEQETPDHAPDVLPIAGLGEIARHSKTDDGRFTILLFGLGRVRIVEVPSDRLYRTVEIESVAEAAAPEEAGERLRGPLLEAIQARTGQELEHIDSITTGQLADVLAQCLQLQLPSERMAAIYSDADAAQRAERALAAHVEFPPE